MTFQYITTQQQLLVCIKKINAVSEISVDLEFDKNRYRYGFNLCLLQIKAGDEIFLIDPLGDDFDIKPVFEPLENPTIQKVVYAFGEDIRLLHTLGCYPKNLFDIVIQTRLIDYPAISLTNLLLEEQGIECSKSSQKSNWFKRPLSDQQLTYAAEDVTFLIELRNQIREKCSDELGEYITEENHQYEVIDYAETKASNGLKDKDKKDLTEYQWYIYNGLMNFREQVASEVNRPSFFVLDKEYLREVAIDHAQLKRWKQLKTVYRNLHNSEFKARIQECLKDLISETRELKLSTTGSAVKRLTNAEFNKLKSNRQEKDKLIADVLKPIHQCIIRDYGENTASFMLSNRIMQHIAYSGLERLPNYRQTLIQKYAKELGVTVTVN
ncbi:MAG: ribonuclease D [Flavobacteriales bacterium]|nr:ribonuclease D [Flavobacteriales bacterium]